VESRYIGDDCGDCENALGLSDEELQMRDVAKLNIADERQLSMTPETDVRNFKSKETERPILDEEGIWMRAESPVMCCYKVCRLDVSTNGLPGRRIEHWGHRHGLQSSFLRYNRQVFCWIDSWIGLGVADVDGFNDGFTENAVIGLDVDVAENKGIRPRLEAAANSIATELATETSAGLAFAFSDETNPFFT